MLGDLSFPVIFNNTSNDLLVKICLNKFSDNKNFYEDSLSGLIVNWMTISLYNGFNLGAIRKEPGVDHMGRMIFEVKREKTINFYVNLGTSPIESLYPLFVVLNNAINKTTKYGFEGYNDIYKKEYPFKIIKIEIVDA